MEFNEKLQELRKQRNMTQDELAQALFVSRTAVSKWESGRGYPNIDSLRGIAAFFSVSLDDLLSKDELLTLADGESRRRVARLRDLVFGLLDVSTLLLLFLPLFGQRADGVVQSVSLLALRTASPWLHLLFMAAVAAMVLIGVATLALQAFPLPRWDSIKNALSLAVHAVSALLFILALQPYAAALLFVLVLIKALMLLGRA